MDLRPGQNKPPMDWEAIVERVNNASDRDNSLALAHLAFYMRACVKHGDENVADVMNAIERGFSLADDLNRAHETRSRIS